MDDMVEIRERMAVVENALAETRAIVEASKDKFARVSAKVIELDIRWQALDKKLDNISNQLGKFEHDIKESVDKLDTKRIVDEEVMKAEEKQNRKVLAIIGASATCIITLVSNYDKIKPLLVAMLK